MMARLEHSEAEADERAREWLSRAIGAAPDPCHVCAACAGESGEWHSLCPRCGGFDTLAWRVPERPGADTGARAAAAALPPMLPASDARLIESSAAKAPDPLGSGATIR